jgi:hypothetical protein
MDVHGLVLAGEFALHRYVMDLPDELPRDRAARRRLAADLVARLEELSEDERRTLRELGEEAGDVLLALVKDKLARIDGRSSEAAWGELNYMMRHLNRSVSSAHTGAMLELLPQAKDYPRCKLLELLGEHGDRRAAPTFLAALRQGEEADSSAYRAAVGYVARSVDPRVIRLLLSALRDENAEPGLREVAFTHLGETGDPAGIAAVLGTQDRRRSLPRLDQHMQLHRLELDLLEENVEIAPGGSWYQGVLV